ncbi:MAG TPA: hypothetical protein VM432_00210 [Bdellovibrionales bacterium]|nr:hypothetical protein [Bdellovibrionales bacterium]
MKNSSNFQSLISLPFGTVVRTTLAEHADLIAEWPLPDELKSANPKRQTEWRLGRLALQKAFAQLRIDVSPEEMIFDGHQALLLVPGFRFSISHTDDAALVWLADEDECKGVGVDLEPRDRAISDAVYKKLLHTLDRSTLSPIQLWSAKEACFKSVSLENQAELVIAKIFVEGERFQTDDLVSGGQWRQFEDSQYLYSFAWRG